MGKLTLKLHGSDDYTDRMNELGKLEAWVEVTGFSGQAEAFIHVPELRKFAASLDTYPIVRVRGEFDRVGVANEPAIAITIAPRDAAGHLRATVELRREWDYRSAPEQVAVLSMDTDYAAVETFRVAIEAMLAEEREDAVLGWPERAY